MGQSEIYKFLLKQKPDVYIASEILKEKVGGICGLSSMINYGEVEMVMVKINGSHIIQYCYRLTKKMRGK